MSMFNLMEKSPMREGNMYLRRHDSSVYHSIMVDTESKILKPILEVIYFKYLYRIVKCILI